MNVFHRSLVTRFANFLIYMKTRDHLTSRAFDNAIEICIFSERPDISSGKTRDSRFTTANAYEKRRFYLSAMFVFRGHNDIIRKYR